jgi:hypothetical protein
MPKHNVDKMAKEADELHRQLYPEQYGDPPLPPDPDPDSTPVVPPTDSEPPAEAPTTQEPPAAPPAAPAAPVEGTPPVPVAPEATQPAQPAPEPWEQRYNTLKGKYDAEVPRLFAEINSLKALINTPPPPPAPPAPSPASATSLTIKEILSGDKELEESLAAFQEDYPDVANLLVKLTERASSVTSGKVNELVNNQVRSVQEFQAESRIQHFWDVVNKELPDWQVIRDDPGFSDWLNETEPYTGLPRAALTQDALQKFDAHRVINIYNGYKNAKHSSQPASAPSSTTPTPPVRPDAALIAPPSGGRAAPSTTPPNTDTPITAAYIQKFYSDAAMGRYKNRQVEFDKIETRINRAVSEGKVV